MANIKKEQIKTKDIAMGMFITELDIPWLDSPFLLQGFVLENSEQFTTLQSLCKVVWIDRTKSIGVQFVASPKEKVAITREGAVIKLRGSNQVKAQTKKSSGPIGTMPSSNNGFFDILRELKNNPNPQLHPISHNLNSTIFNQKNVTETTISEPHNSKYNIESKNLSASQQVKHDVSNLFGKLFSWTSRKNKVKYSSDRVSESKSSEIAEGNDHRVTIFEEAPLVENEIAAIYPVYEKSQLATRELFSAIANQQNLDLTHVIEIVDSMVDSIERTPDALMWLAKLKQTDDYAYDHAINVSINLMAFASFLALPKKQIKELGLAGLLQDIGKVNVPTEILLKPGELTPEEFEIAKKHVDEGLSILEKTPNIPSSVIFLVAQHHERIDGSGYPYKLSEKKINIESQIAGLIDTYCAITSNKPYAKGLYNQQALEKIYKFSGRQFSNKVVDQLVQFLGIYPVSSLVELNTGEVGVVIQQNQVRRLQPRVMILLAPDKSRNEYPTTINLLHSPLTPMGEPYAILNGVSPDDYGLDASDFYL